MRAGFIVAAVAASLLGVFIATTGLHTSFRLPLEMMGHRSFDLSPLSLQQWFCPDVEGECSLDQPMHKIKERALLRMTQTLWDNLPALIFYARTPAEKKAASKLSALLETPRPKSLREAVETYRATGLGESTTHDNYFNVFPVIEGSVIPGGPSLVYSSPCFETVNVTAVWSSSTNITVTVQAEGQKAFLCSDSMMLFSAATAALPLVDEAKEYSFVLQLSDAVGDLEARQWFVNHRGVNVGRFNQGFIEVVLNAIPTATMMGGFGEFPLTSASLDANYHFYRNYIQASDRMGPKSEWRSAGAVVASELNPDEIQSGDTFFISRPDGTDPMIGWATGGAPGHTTVALRSPNGTLHVCESTTNDSYWDRNGIQCHTWEDWWPMAAAAQFNAVLLPLSSEARAKFNVTAAWEWYHETEGLDYGFMNMVFLWLDVPFDNSPCLPPDFTTCVLTEPMIEFVAMLVDDFMGDQHRNIFRQALNHRIGTWPKNNSVAQVIQQGQENFGYMNFSDLYTIVEQDSWMYNTTRYGEPTVGPSQVCNVFACNIYRHAGVFDDIDSDFHCTEQTLWGGYSLTIFDTNKTGTGRPKICQETDPDNALCQITGNMTFHLVPGVGTRKPYKHMGDHCPTKGPDYIRPDDC